MKYWHSTVWIALYGAGLVAAACSSSQGTGGAPVTTPPSEDAGGNVVTPAADAGDAGGGVPPGDAPQTYLRIAQVSPDLPAIDVCVAAHGTTTFKGPLLAQLAGSLAAGGSEDAGPDAAVIGLTYSQVSAYIALDPGQYDVRIVSAGASSCHGALGAARVVPQTDDGGDADASVPDGDVSDAGPLDASLTQDAASDAATLADGGATGATEDAGALPGPPDTTGLAPLAASGYATLLIAGEASPAGSDQALSVTLLADDAVLAGGGASLRTVNALPQFPSIDVGLGAAGSSWLPLFTGVSFGTAGTTAGAGAGTPDANGYLTIAPLAAQAMGARAAAGDAGGGGDGSVGAAAASSVEIDLASIATIIAIGGKTGDAANPPALLLCIDNLPSGGLLSDCSVAH